MTDDVFWTPAKVERLKQLRQDGRSYKEIAQVLRTTKNAVIGKMNRLGAATASKPWSKGQLAMLRASVDAGVHFRAIAIVLDRSLAAVKHRAHAMGLKPPGVAVTLPATSRADQNDGVRYPIVTQPVAVPRHNSAQPAADAPSHDAPHAGIPFIRRGVFQCAYIAARKVKGEPVNCCGKRVTKPGSPWCSDHWSVVYRKVQVLEAAE